MRCGTDRSAVERRVEGGLDVEDRGAVERPRLRSWTPSVCRSSGWSVRLPAKLTLAPACCSPPRVAWPGGLPCPWTRATVDALACSKAARGKLRSQRSRPDWMNCRPWSARVPAWLVGRLRLGVGHASTVRPDPSTLGAAGDRGSRREGRLPVRARQTKRSGSRRYAGAVSGRRQAPRWCGLIATWPTTTEWCTGRARRRPRPCGG
jgi:hypothetical protein